MAEPRYYIFRKHWYLRLWILSLSSLSPILRLLAFGDQPHQGEQAQVQYHAQGRRVLSLHQYHERHPRLIITQQLKRMVVSISGPYPDVGAANAIKRDFWTGFSFPQVYQSAFQSLLLYYH